jgi:crotonobetainyl-CoA:carnitine CoA-transferase CaiB-like acyl-CoA transferase
MSAPSRRPEIRRRRTRAEKIAKLRKRLAAASTSTDKERLTARLHRAGLVSPGIPLIKSA